MKKGFFTKLVALTLVLTLFVGVTSTFAAEPELIVEYEEQEAISQEYDGFFQNIGNAIKKAAQTVVSAVIHAGNAVAQFIGIDTASIGGKILQMESESTNEGKVFHATQDCLQKLGGYNSFYDVCFDLGTSMETLDKIKPYKYEGKWYKLWTWKGDYINLGAGAEIGIYSGDKEDTKLWKAATGHTLEMTVALYDKSHGNKKIFEYVPGTYSGDKNGKKTWWCTGFNSNYMAKDFGRKATNLKAVYTCKFSNAEEFNAFRGKYDSSSNTVTLSGNKNGATGTLTFYPSTSSIKIEF